MSEIFTPSILIDDQHEKIETFERHGSLRETHSNKLAGDERLRSFKKLLYNGNELEKRVFLVGEAGAGKTTFCKHLTDMWCQINHTNEECKSPILQQLEDVTVLKQFQYLFYISCRFAEEKETIFDMINNQLFDDDKMKEIAKYVLKHNPEDCFIILDGADEWKGSPTSETGRRGDIAGLPGMAGVDSCVIFITSRPWRFHALSEKTQKFFRCLKLKGIADVNMLVESILQKHPEPVRSSKDFLKQVEENGMSDLMEIPLILLIALGCWIDDKSFHKFMCINYINMIQSLICRLKGHAGWLSSESRLRVFPILYDLERKWGQRSNELPPSLSTYKHLHRYAGLFLSLGQLAFDLLLGKGEQSLIFSKADLTSYLQADDENDESVNVCLALGILSKAETTKRGIKKVENYAFCHKTFQEIFAALWLTSGYTNEASKQYKYIENIQNLYSCDLMITFLCTIEPDTGKKFWIDLMEEDRIRVINLYETTMNHQSLQQLSGSLSSFSVLKSLELNHLRCSDHRDKCRCRIPVIDLRKCNQLKSLKLSYLLVEGLLLPREGVRFSELSLRQVSMTHRGIKQLSRSLSSLSCIEQLDLDELKCSEYRDMLCLPVLDLQKHNKLDKLELYGLYVEGLLLPMEGSRIRLLRLLNVRMAHHKLKQLSRSLSSLSCIEQLDLYGVRCSDRSRMPVLDLRKHNKLDLLELSDLYVEGLLLPMEGTRIRLLKLSNVKMAHHELEQLSRSLSSLSCLEQLDLDVVSCDDHRDMSCIPVLDLQKHSELEILCICGLSIERLLLPMERARIRQLALVNVTMAHHELEQLSRSVSSLSCIEQLDLDEVRCSEHRDRCCIPVLDLLQHNKLKELNIRKLSVESLLLSMRGARIRSLGLHNVTMTHHGLEELSRSLSSMSDTEYLSIDGVDCSEHRNSSCQCVKDIRA